MSGALKRDEWETVRLGDVCDIQYGFAFDSKQFSESSGTPLIRIRDVVRGFTETYTSEKYAQEYLVHSGDILVGMDGEFNIARWKSGPALLNQRVCRLTAKSKIESQYLLYLMQGVLKEIEDKTPCVTVKHLSAKVLTAVTFPLPPLDVQRRIAETLDKVTELITLRKTQLKKLDELVKARFVEMFENRNYPVAKLGEVCTKITDGTHKTPTYLERGVTFISAKNIVNGELDFSDVKYISEHEYDEIQKRCQTELSDILLSKSGSLGSPVIVKTTERIGLFESLAVIKYDRSKLLPEFLCEQLKTDRIQRQFKVGTKGVAIKHLHLGVIADTNIIVPPIDEQLQFAAFVKQTNKAKAPIQQSLDTLGTLKQSLMQEYFG